jgi:hypothetical protein
MKRKDIALAMRIGESVIFSHPIEARRFASIMRNLGIKANLAWVGHSLEVKRIPKWIQAHDDAMGLSTLPGREEAQHEQR